MILLWLIFSKLFASLLAFTLHLWKKLDLAFNYVKPKEKSFVFDQVRLRTGLGCVRLTPVNKTHYLIKFQPLISSFSGNSQQFYYLILLNALKNYLIFEFGISKILNVEFSLLCDPCVYGAARWGGGPCDLRVSPSPNWTLDF